MVRSHLKQKYKTRLSFKLGVLCFLFKIQNFSRLKCIAFSRSFSMSLCQHLLTSMIPLCQKNFFVTQVFKSWLLSYCPWESMLSTDMVEPFATILASPFTGCSRCSWKGWGPPVVDWSDCPLWSPCCNCYWPPQRWWPSHLGTKRKRKS